MQHPSKLVPTRRKLAVLKVKKLVQKLAADELQLHQSLDPELAKVLEGKNLLAWKALMERRIFSDPTLFQELTNGFKLTRQACSSPQFQGIRAYATDERMIFFPERRPWKSVTLDGCMVPVRRSK